MYQLGIVIDKQLVLNVNADSKESQLGKASANIHFPQISRYSQYHLTRFPIGDIRIYSNVKKHIYFESYPKERNTFGC